MSRAVLNELFSRINLNVFMNFQSLSMFSVKEIVDFRGKCQKLFSYDWINIPLVYTQVSQLTVARLNLPVNYDLA